MTITPGGPDPFDADRLRLPQGFTQASGVKRLLTAVPVGRPPTGAFFRAHTGGAAADAVGAADGIA